MHENSLPSYDDRIIKIFTITTLIWLVIGLTAGLYIAAELSFPALNFDSPWLSFGRLRPVHTTSIVLGFGGNVLFASSFYIVQRTCAARLAGNYFTHNFIFWGYQLFLVLSITGYMLGITQAKEYAEPEWYADLLLVLVWVAYFTIYVMTIMKRQEKHIYVSNWFFLSYIIMVAVLHIVNSLAIPLSLTSPHSVPMFGGVQSAMIQWWYGHNIVGFFLTAGFLGIAYYFIPKRSMRPVYSYRLSILHFWGIVFLYIWAGPHHLHYTALPDWTQTLGMTMSLMLWIPSWGGMVNGIMSVSGAWHKLREDPVLQFIIIALAFYGMSTFEGPVMAIKAVNALSHYTEWTISHVHSGALGWVGYVAIGAMYHMVPRLFGKEEMYSIRLINAHLWISAIGIVIYITSMWGGGIMQGLMWRSYNDMGFLEYSFIEVVKQLHPLYIARMIGGAFYLLGGIIMCYNIAMTIKYGKKYVGK